MHNPPASTSEQPRDDIARAIDDIRTRWRRQYLSRAAERWKHDPPPEIPNHVFTYTHEGKHRPDFSQPPNVPAAGNTVSGDHAPAAEPEMPSENLLEGLNKAELIALHREIEKLKGQRELLQDAQLGMGAVGTAANVLSGIPGATVPLRIIGGVSKLGVVGLEYVSGKIEDRIRELEKKE